MAIYSVAVTAPAAFPAANAPSVIIPFEPKSITVINEDSGAANSIEVSFDGVEVHGKLIPTQVAALKFSQSVTKVWLRRAAGTPTVRIVAES